MDEWIFCDVILNFNKRFTTAQNNDINLKQKLTENVRFTLI
jgi:hypothetical protein